MAGHTSHRTVSYLISSRAIPHIDPCHTSHCPGSYLTSSRTIPHIVPWFQYTVFSGPNPGSRIQNPGFQIQNPGSRVQNTGFYQKPVFWVQNPGFRSQILVFRVQIPVPTPKYRFSDPKSRFQKSCFFCDDVWEAIPHIVPDHTSHRPRSYLKSHGPYLTANTIPCLHKSIQNTVLNNIFEYS